MISDKPQTIRRFKVTELEIPIQDNIQDNIVDIILGALQQRGYSIDIENIKNDVGRVEKVKITVWNAINMGVDDGNYPKC